MDPSLGEPPGPAGRRKFLAGVVWAAGGAIAATLAGLLARFFAAPIFARSRGPSVEIALGPVARFRDAKDPVPAFYERRLSDGYLESVEKGRVYVVAEGGRFLCLSTACTHLGCSVSWDAERRRFLCPCHGGAYARDGTVISGPPPRGLVKIPVRVENGQLKIRVEEPA